jgi:DNA-binding Lrp family transcriptional regulator
MIDRRVIGLASDPDRLNALTLLNERSAGAAEVAERLEIDAAAAGRLLDRMHDAGLIELVGEALSRGAVEPRYRALVRVLWDDEEWAALGAEEQQRLSNWILSMIMADAGEAIDRGTFTGRLDTHVSRTTLRVDEQGWQELTRIYSDALKAVFAVQAESAERLAEAGEAGVSVLSALLCCELPPRGEAATG